MREQRSRWSAETDPGSSMSATPGDYSPTIEILVPAGTEAIPVLFRRISMLFNLDLFDCASDLPKHLGHMMQAPEKGKYASSFLVAGQGTVGVPVHGSAVQRTVPKSRECFVAVRSRHPLRRSDLQK